MTAPQPEIIFFGRLEERKGLLEFVEAATALAADGKGSFSLTFLGKDVRLYSAATGRVQSSEYIRQKLSGLGCPLRLLCGYSSGEAIAYVRQSPGCVVCLASPSDNFPNASLEMAQIPVPLVVSDTTGFHQTLELAGRSEGIFWFQPGSARSLREGLTRALAAADTTITVPATAAIEAVNERLAEARVRLVEDAAKTSRPTWLPTDWLARVFVLADGPPPAVRKTLRSLQGASANIIDVVVLIMAEWMDEEARSLRESFPHVLLIASDNLRQAVADSSDDPRAISCQRLLLLRSGTTVQPTTLRNFLEADVRAGAAMVTAAQWEGPHLENVRTFGPGSVSLLLEANGTSGSCVLVRRAFLDSLPPPTARSAPLLIWQLTLAAAATGQNIAYIPFPQYALACSGEAAEAGAPSERDLAQLSRYAASIPPERWTRRQIFGLALTAQQLRTNLHQARAESNERLAQARAESDECRRNAEALTAEISAQQEEAARLRAALQEAERHHAGARQELAAAYASKSWRWTGGLRLFYRVLAAWKARA